MIGLYHSVRVLPHTIYNHKLLIRLGYQSNIELDIKNIENIKAAKEQGGIGEKTPKETYYAMLNIDRKSTRLNSSHVAISYAVFCLKKKKRQREGRTEN